MRQQTTRNHVLPDALVAKNRIYDARRRARKAGLPLPPLPTGRPNYSTGTRQGGLGHWQPGNYYLEKRLLDNRLELLNAAQNGKSIVIVRRCQDCMTTAPRWGFAPVFLESGEDAYTLLCNECYDKRCCLHC